MRRRVWRARLAPLPRRSTAWTVSVAGGREQAGEAGQLRGGRQRPVEKEHVERAVAEGPVRDGRAVRSHDVARSRGVAGSRRARSSVRRSLPFAVRGRASSRMNAAGTLNRASRCRQNRSAPRRRGPGRRGGGRSPPPAPGRTRRRGGRRRPASAMAGWSRRTASTSAGAMFSPPRTIRSVRRSSDGQPAVRHRAGRGRRSAASRRRQGGGGRRRVAEVAARTGPGCRPRSRRRRRRPGRRSGARPRGVPGRRSRGGSRLAGREGRDPGAGLGQAVGRDDRPARVERTPDEGGRDRPATERDRAKGRGRGRVGDRVEDPGERSSGTSETWLGAGSAASAATMAAGSGRGRTTSGTPVSAARQTTPRPGDVAEPERQQPAGRRREGGEPRLGAGDHARPSTGRPPSGGRSCPRSGRRPRGQRGRRAGRRRVARRRRVQRRALEGERRSTGEPRAGRPRSPRADDDDRGSMTSAATASSRRVKPHPSGAATAPDPGDPVERRDGRRRTGPR